MTRNHRTSVLSAVGNSGCFATICGGRPSAPGGAWMSSAPATNATAVGCFDSKRFEAREFCHEAYFAQCERDFHPARRKRTWRAGQRRVRRCVAALRAACS
jgi:hypothetical protein